MLKMKSIFCTLFLCLTFITPLSSVAAGDVLHTSYNIWYEPGKEKRLWCINYKKGIMIPAGTKVRDINITPSAISFFTVRDGNQFQVKFNRKYHPGKSIQDYVNMMFTEKNFTELTQGLSEKEVKAIREGVIVLGMSKKGVVTSYGYPPEHRTPSVETNVWTYWLDRFRSKKYHFDENGRTIRPAKGGDQL